MYLDKRGYRKLITWQKANELRKSVYAITKGFPKSEMRRISQMNDSARSVKQNIQEGYKRRTLGEYIRSLNISQGSLGELIGDIEDCFNDKLINKEEFELLDKSSGQTDYFLKCLVESLIKKREKEGRKGYNPLTPF
mgnify:CR=1 FL=1